MRWMNMKWLHDRIQWIENTVCSQVVDVCDIPNRTKHSRLEVAHWSCLTIEQLKSVKKIGQTFSILPCTFALDAPKDDSKLASHRPNMRTGSWHEWIS